MPCGPVALDRSARRWPSPPRSSRAPPATSVGRARPRRRRRGRRLLARGRLRRPVRDRRQLRRRPRRRPHHPLVPQERLVRDPVAPAARARSWSRAPTATRIALVKNDLYIPQDLLYRRTAQLLEQGDSGITRANLTIAVTHDHSSPYYSVHLVGRVGVPGRLRRALLRLLREAHGGGRRAGRRRPEAGPRSAPRSAPSTRRTATRTGPTVADDGTPAGYPHEDTDHDLTVVRFDDVSDPANPKPLANLVNFSLHPEFLNGNDLISADYVAPLQRMVDRETGGAHHLHAERGRHRRAGAQHLPLDARAARVHAPRVRAGRVRRAPDERRDRRHVARRRARDARAPRPLRAVRRLARGRDGGPLVPGPALAPVSRRLQLPRRQGVRRRPAVPGRRPARPARTASACCRASPSIFGLPRTARPADRADRPGHLDRRLPGARDPAARELLGARPTPGWRRTSASTCRRSGWATSCSRSARASSGTTSRATSRRAPTIDAGQRATTATTGPRAAPTTATRPAPGPARTRATRRPRLPPIPTQNFLRMKAQVNNDAERLERPVEHPVGGVGADRPDPDQGQLHARRAAARARLPADGPDLDGERLQRLHRELPRVPARRPLPQGADRLGPALERLHGVAPGGDGRPPERRARAAAPRSARRRSSPTSRSTTSAPTSWARSARPA